MRQVILSAHLVGLFLSHQHHTAFILSLNITHRNGILKLTSFLNGYVIFVIPAFDYLTPAFQLVWF